MNISRFTGGEVLSFDRRFVVSSRMLVSLVDGEVSLALEACEPFEKEIPVEEHEPSDTNLILIAHEEEVAVGRILLIPWWNGFAWLDDLIVTRAARGRGIGAALLEKGIDWAREQGYPGVMLETQDDNVAAIEFYQKHGFILGGLDFLTLHNVKPGETALYWYLVF